MFARAASGQPCCLGAHYEINKIKVWYLSSILTCTASNDLSLLVLKVSLMYSNRDLPEGRKNIMTLRCQPSLDSDNRCDTSRCKNTNKRKKVIKLVETCD